MFAVAPARGELYQSRLRRDSAGYTAGRRGRRFLPRPTTSQQRAPRLHYLFSALFGAVGLERGAEHRPTAPNSPPPTHRTRHEQSERVTISTVTRHMAFLRVCSLPSHGLLPLLSPTTWSPSSALSRHMTSFLCSLPPHGLLPLLSPTRPKAPINKHVVLNICIIASNILSH